MHHPPDDQPAAAGRRLQHQQLGRRDSWPSRLRSPPGAAQTAASTNETTATVEEVKQTAHAGPREGVAGGRELRRTSPSVAEAGRATVEETITGIERMQSQMGVVAETINRLSDQTQAVGDIIATVNDLAEQSNLLSVNASIEAAKAGDQGKGFTVVAQEVKSLAEQSKQAVAQVRTILCEIQKAERHGRAGGASRAARPSRPAGSSRWNRARPSRRWPRARTRRLSRRCRSPPPAGSSWPAWSR